MNHCSEAIETRAAERHIQHLGALEIAPFDKPSFFVYFNKRLKYKVYCKQAKQLALFMLMFVLSCIP